MLSCALRGAVSWAPLFVVSRGFVRCCRDWWGLGVWVGWFNRAMDAQCCTVGGLHGVVAVYCLFCGGRYRAWAVFQGRGGARCPCSPGGAP